MQQGYKDDGKIHDKERLKELQSLPLERKIGITTARIIEWYKFYEGQVCVSFSGGKDSTVLLYMVRKLFPDVEAVFVDTGLEYPEIRKFVKSFDNVTILKPEMKFNEVIRKYGYPLISKEVSNKISSVQNGSNWAIPYVNGTAIMNNGKKSYYCVDKYSNILNMDFKISNKCCSIMKKSPSSFHFKKTDKRPITAQMACESNLRKSQWIKNGCNSFDSKNPVSNPMSFWTEQDVLQYIKEFNLPIASVYGNIVCEKGKLKTSGCNRTGCMFCAFGCHLEKGITRFQRLKLTHPRQYEYCINGGEYDENGVWKPNVKGLGMGHVFDELNKVYGENFIRYK